METLRERQYEQIKDAVGEEVFEQTFARIKAKYRFKRLNLWLEYADRENKIADEEFKQIIGALECL